LPRRPTTLRFETLAAQGHEHGPRAGHSVPIARSELRYDPRIQSLPAPRTKRGVLSDTRTLIVTLFLVALLPNLTVAAFVWHSSFDTEWAAAVTPMVQPESATAALEDVQPTQAAAVAPVLTAPARLEAKAGEDVPFPIALDGVDGVPARSSIAINGLPAGANLSDGRPYGETGWNLKTDEIGDLRLTLPSTATGEANLSVQLIGPDGGVIASAETALVATTDREAAPVNLFASNEHDVGVAGEQANDASHVGTETAAAEHNGPDAAKAANHGQSSTGPAAHIGDDAAEAQWIQSPTFVNLRERPSSSAPVISVVAKGAKLSVLGRKRGWVQVTNPATSERGWIYAGNASRRGGKRSRHPESSSDESVWTSMGRWLTGS
jgi:hypothetical protein